MDIRTLAYAIAELVLDPVILVHAGLVTAALLTGTVARLVELAERAGT